MTTFNVGDRVRNVDPYLEGLDSVPIGALGTVGPKMSPWGFLRVQFDDYPFSQNPNFGWPVMENEIEKVE